MIAVTANQKAVNTSTISIIINLEELTIQNDFSGMISIIIMKN